MQQLTQTSEDQRMGCPHFVKELPQQNMHVRYKMEVAVNEDILGHSHC